TSQNERFPTAPPSTEHVRRCVFQPENGRGGTPRGVTARAPSTPRRIVRKPGHVPGGCYFSLAAGVDYRPTRCHAPFTTAPFPPSFRRQPDRGCSHATACGLRP